MAKTLIALLVLLAAAHYVAASYGSGYWEDTYESEEGEADLYDEHMSAINDLYDENLNLKTRIRQLSAVLAAKRGRSLLTMDQIKALPESDLTAAHCCAAKRSKMCTDNFTPKFAQCRTKHETHAARLGCLRNKCYLATQYFPSHAEVPFGDPYTDKEHRVEHEPHVNPEGTQRGRSGGVSGGLQSETTHATHGHGGSPKHGGKKH